MRLPISVLFLALCATRLQALTIVAPPPVLAAPDSARISFSALHTWGRNWLQIQIAPVGACQRILIDSVVVSDTAASELASHVATYLGGVPRRDVRVRWHLVQDASGSTMLGNTCEGVKASRHVVELPRPRVSPGNDSTLARWVPGFVVARGAGRVDTAEAVIIDHTRALSGISCPVYDFSCAVVIAPSDTGRDAKRSFLDSLRVRNARGLTLFLVRGAGDSLRIPVHPDSLPYLDRLGPAGMWGAGNRAWIEEVPIRAVKSWGPSARTEWRKRTGRVFHRWFNNAGPCCANCDTLCDRGSLAEGVSSSGVDVELSNDSSQYCGYLPHIGSDISSALKKDWLILPDTAELATGILDETFNTHCFSRVRTWAVEGDSVVAGGVRIALADLDGLVGTAPRTAHAPGLRVEATPAGLFVRSGLGAGAEWAVTVRDPSGRILSKSSHAVPDAAIVLRGRGLVVVDVVSEGGLRRAKAIR